MITISKEIEFDAGHRVPTHHSKCKNPHGHRYKVRVTCSGEIIDDPNSSDHGMLIDFGDLKSIMTKEIHDLYDHGMIIYQYDNKLLDCLLGQGWKIIRFPYIPTAENLAISFWDTLEPIISSHWNGSLKLEEVAVWETPSSVAYRKR